MESFDWFGLVFAVIGGVCVFSSAYEWTWWWRLARGFYLPDLIGRDRTRLAYVILGFFLVGDGTGGMIISVTPIPKFVAFLIGFIVSALVTKLIYESREGQSINQLFRKKPTNENND